MDSKEKLNQLLEAAKDYVRAQRDIMVPGQDWEPEFLGLNSDDELIVIPVSPGLINSANARELIYKELLPDMIREHRLWGLVTIMSTWMVFEPTDGLSQLERKRLAEEVGRKSLREHPNRKEALFLYLLTRFEMEGWAAPIIRSSDVLPPFLGGWIRLPDELVWEGRMVTPLQGALAKLPEAAADK